MVDASDQGGESLPPHDTTGCILFAARGCCGMAILQILMALAIIAAALVGLIFFR